MPVPCGTVHVSVLWPVLEFTETDTPEQAFEPTTVVLPFTIFVPTIVSLPPDVLMLLVGEKEDIVGGP